MDKAGLKSLRISILITLISIISATAATVAWFSIADNVKIRNMRMEVTSGYMLRMDTVAHQDFDDYQVSLSLADIIAENSDFIENGEYEIPLEPVTTGDGKIFKFEDGTVVEADSGTYLEFIVHFMANQDMIVHLTSLNSQKGQDGTRISSDNPDLALAMRTSFTARNKTYIYNPGMGNESMTNSNIKYFGLPDSTDMDYNEDNALWVMKKGVDVPVIMRIWLEGTDKRCTNDLKGYNYEVQFRFEGTDSNHNQLMSSRE